MPTKRQKFGACSQPRINCVRSPNSSGQGGKIGENIAGLLSVLSFFTACNHQLTPPTQITTCLWFYGLGSPRPLTILDENRPDSVQLVQLVHGASPASSATLSDPDQAIVIAVTLSTCSKGKHKADT
jgi:hypothetical protein